MTRRLLVLALSALPLLAAAAFAGTSTNDVSANASKRCTALQARLGSSFGQTFPTFGACVASLTPLEIRNASIAAAACRSESADPGFAAAHGGKSFAAIYGKGRKHKRAFADCVAIKARASSAAEQAIANPYQTCTSLHGTLSADDFAQRYGTGDGAFPQCVTAAARAQVAAELSAAAACNAERADAGFAGSHGGKTFAQAYGTNADLSNAFGRCVAQKALAFVTAQLRPAARPTPVPPPTDRCGAYEGTAPLKPSGRSICQAVQPA